MQPFIISVLFVLAIGWVVIQSSAINYDPLFHQLIMMVFVISVIAVTHFWPPTQLAIKESFDSSSLETVHNILAYLAPVTAAIGGIGGIFWNIKSESIDPVTQVKTIDYNGKAKVSVIFLLVGLLLSGIDVSIG